MLENRLAKGNQVGGGYLLPSNPSVHMTEHLILCKRNEDLCLLGSGAGEGSSGTNSPSTLIFPPSEAELAHFQFSLLQDRGS